MKPRLLVVLSVVLLVLAITPNAWAADPIKVGYIGGLTGYLVDIDAGARDGIIIAVDEINRGGGLLGRKLELLIEDNRSEPSGAVTALNKLLAASKADLILGGASSAGTRAMSPILVRRKMPGFVLSIMPAADDKDGQRWIYSGSPVGDWDLQTRFAYMKKQGWTRVAVLHDTTPYATFVKDTAVKLAPGFGVTVLGVEQYSPGATDLRAQLTKLKALEPQAVFQVGAGPAIGIVAKNLRDAGLNVPHLSDANTNPGEVVKIAGPAAQGLLFPALPPAFYDVLPANDARRTTVRNFVEAFRAKFGKDRDPNYAARGYDMMMLLGEAVRRAKSIEGHAVRDALEGIKDYRGVIAVRSFTPDNHVGMDKSPFSIVRIEGSGTVKLLD